MMQDRKTIAISEIVKIIEECRYNDELAEGYKREILDQEKVYDQRAKGAQQVQVIASNSSGGATSGVNLTLRILVNIPNLQ